MIKVIDFTEISNAIFNPLKSWAEQSQGNWNILIVGGFGLVMIGAILTFMLYRKMGKPDERTRKIALNSALLVLYVVVLCDIIFPKEYMWQVFLLFKYGLAFLASTIYLAIRYKKDFY